MYWFLLIKSICIICKCQCNVANIVNRDNSDSSFALSGRYLKLNFQKAIITILMSIYWYFSIYYLH